MAHCKSSVTSILSDCVVFVGKSLAEKKYTNLSQWRKSCGDIVTDADIYSHETLHRLLTQKLPNIPLLMEEGINNEKVLGDSLPHSNFIVVDELDGTLVYTCGGIDWGVTCAYIENNKVISSVIFLPDRDILIESTYGKGTSINGKRISINKKKSCDISVAIVEINKHLSQDQFEYIQGLSKRVSGVRSLACSTASFAELLLGRSHIYVNFNGGMIWDFAAGSLALEEAGGYVRDENFKTIGWKRLSMGIIAWTSSHHEELLIQR